MAGPFVNYVAGIYTSYRFSAVFIALTDVGFLRVLFQRHVLEISQFPFADFTFHYVGTPEQDIMLYNITHGTEFDMCVAFYGIDSDPCGPESNLDFVYFAWLNFERFAFRKHALVLLPSDDFLADERLEEAGFSYVLQKPLMRFLRHHRACSDGWNDPYNCDECVVSFREQIDMCPCLAPRVPCFCGVCLRQPPSLIHSALHTVRTLVLHVEQFELTAVTTYDEYRFAVRSNACPVNMLIPPEYPELRFWYRHDLLARSPQKFHKDCPGEGPFGSFSRAVFQDPLKCIEELVNHRDHFWCAYCNRGLFFPNNCDEDHHHVG